MNRPFSTASGGLLDRMEISSWNLEDPEQLAEFLKPSAVEVGVPFSEKKALYDPFKKTGVGISRLGTSRAVSVGAYAFALSRLEKNHP
jgi:glucokinase